MKKVLSIIATGIIVASCGGGDNEVVEGALQSNREEHAMLIERIDSLENIVFTDTFDLNQASASALLKDYNMFTAKFPADDEKCPEYLYKAAAIARGVDLPVRALKYYQAILSDYPNYIKSSESAFLLAFTYDEDLGEPELAKEAYQYVIDKYPGDMWALQSEERLKTIDMSDEELIQFFMEKNAKAEN